MKEACFRACCGNLVDKVSDGKSFLRPVFVATCASNMPFCIVFYMLIHSVGCRTSAWKFDQVVPVWHDFELLYGLVCTVTQ